MGKGVSKAVETVNKVLGPAVVVCACILAWLPYNPLHANLSTSFAVVFLLGLEPHQPEGD